MRGITVPKKRTDGIVAWLAACLNQATQDPIAEPRHFRAALSIPHHWRTDGVRSSPNFPADVATRSSATGYKSH